MDIPSEEIGEVAESFGLKLVDDFDTWDTMSRHRPTIGNPLPVIRVKKMPEFKLNLWDLRNAVRLTEGLHSFQQTRSFIELKATKRIEPDKARKVYEEFIKSLFEVVDVPTRSSR